MEKNVVLKKAPKGIEGKKFELEFTGNLDNAIQKMKWNTFCELDDTQVLQLKCCLLFICGMPFSKISEKLGLSKSTISKYLNDKLLEGLLSFEYRTLFLKNKNRLQLECKSSKIKRAVETFIEQNGDYQKTSHITGFSERTLSRYFNAPLLLEILDNKKLYLEFCKVRDRHISEIKSKAAKRKYDIKSSIDALCPSGIKEKRYLSLCNALLVEEIDDMKGLMEYTGMSRANIESYLKDISKSGSLFPESLFNLFYQKANEVTDSMSYASIYEEQELNILKTYMASRYSYQEIEELFGIKDCIITNILNEKSKTLLSAEEYVLLQQYKKNVNSLLRGQNKNQCLIKDSRMIAVVKPDVVFVSPSEFHILTKLVQFLTIYTNIKNYDPTESLSEMETYLIMNMSHLKRLLKEEVYLDLERTLSIEKLLFGNELQQKYQYIMFVVTQFFKDNFNLETTAANLEITVSSLIRILQNEFIETNYGKIIYEYIKYTIENYREVNQRKEGESAKKNRF